MARLRKQVIFVWLLFSIVFVAATIITCWCICQISHENVSWHENLTRFCLNWSFYTGSRKGNIVWHNHEGFFLDKNYTYLDQTSSFGKSQSFTYWSRSLLIKCLILSRVRNIYDAWHEMLCQFNFRSQSQRPQNTAKDNSRQNCSPQKFSLLLKLRCVRAQQR